MPIEIILDAVLATFALAAAYVVGIDRGRKIISNDIIESSEFSLKNKKDGRMKTFLSAEKVSLLQEKYFCNQLKQIQELSKQFLQQEENFSDQLKEIEEMVEQMQQGENFSGQLKEIEEFAKQL